MGEGVVIEADVAVADGSLDGGVHINVGGNAADRLGALMELGRPA